MPQPFDSTVVRTWIALALEAVGEGRAEIDAINVFPVADGDTGTNLQRTLDAAARALDAEWQEREAPAAPALRALARGALLGACGNSGTIMAQLLRGMAEVYAGADAGERRSEDAEVRDGQAAEVPGGARPDGAGTAEVPGDGRQLARALRRAADSAYEAVAHPVEGTMLTVAGAAADAAVRHADSDPAAGAADVARAAHERSREALAETTGQLDVLRRAGVVDAGGSGLVAVLGALAGALEGDSEADGTRTERPRPSPYEAPRSGGNHGAGHGDGGGDADGSGGAYEVMYLLDADDAAVAALRERLDGMGDSLVVGGGDGLWSVHVHVDDAGAAVEAGLGAGRPHRIRVTHLASGGAASAAGGCRTAPVEAEPQPDAAAADSSAPCAPSGRRGRAVVAVVHGDGLAGLCEEAGARVVRAKEAFGAPDGEPLAEAVHASGAAEVVLLPNDTDLHAAATRAAEASRAAASAPRVAVVPTRAAVQGIAALAVHDPERRFDDDVVAMTNAAGATRYGEVTVAERPFWTMAGVCAEGDVLGLVEDDVVVIGDDVAAAASDVLGRMLAAGGEMVTLIVGDGAPPGLADGLEEQVRAGHLGVDTVVYDGRQRSSLLLIGVE